MRKMRKIVGVSVAIAVAVAFAAYVLLPRAGQNTNNALVNQPQTPGATNNGTTNTGTGGTGGTPSTPPPRVRPDKLHGENSHGPKHLVCLPLNPHVQGVAQYQGANWDRGQCPDGSLPVPASPVDFIAALVASVAGFFGLAH